MDSIVKQLKTIEYLILEKKTSPSEKALGASARSPPADPTDGSLTESPQLCHEFVRMPFAAVRSSEHAHCAEKAGYFPIIQLPAGTLQNGFPGQTESSKRRQKMR